MPNIKVLIDNFGILFTANQVLPTEYKTALLEALAELEDNDRHIKRDFPKTRLHKVTGCKQAVYRADIDKISGWRLHLQYDKQRDALVLKDIISGQSHDDVLDIIKSRKDRYE